ncbi:MULTISPECIES: flavin prenyltransferase UbiX [Prochlorococcus]|uniref:Flavin prenyltransferase UbiX n=1 Tax=Prochlorococcus marinus (strain SARG / CCMP1375 / SS120) TaxID=167539 RepID=Q7VBV3_PROMA|nr:MULTISPECIES: flavin prenyltransferase UbiX [Prochlorococcus]AAQ00034.1 3-polyprenyl-4-hydroxybenzoate decarboxylase [Prochlorococcus marinus subsp. marinus str. CCMP1375]KGG13831.1 3-polyprenyl-4-hydroxybenzoate carboxy-lyase UbiX [Prochlorococcus marinus str. LG]KGG18965.1 3-polyprenyl-4-hydroxybenzoate carboxy-lyase UbiX [Prochlorococcus marinus str. SS2]KGG23496.1 3-polyprenyl-4-hydroxybenzoate carboxy-lyase UbiX [Prochlorococcus marinus str. SS35]KGG32268.1 3-polyprenyl-4-hydroxybenzoa
MSSIVLAITGASAQILAERSIDLLLRCNQKLDVIISKGAYEVWKSEMNVNIPAEGAKQATFWRNRLKNNQGEIICHKWNDNSATIASGSFRTKGMVIVPCSMGTIGRIASGSSINLIERCADVHLKEGRPLIISPRESPFNLIHLRNMTTLCEAGAKIIPCIPAWYSKPKDLEEVIDFMVVRLYDLFDLNMKDINRWKGN